VSYSTNNKLMFWIFKSLKNRFYKHNPSIHLHNPNMVKWIPSVESVGGLLLGVNEAKLEVLHVHLSIYSINVHI
jgi:hypothetical protein